MTTAVLLVVCGLLAVVGGVAVVALGCALGAAFTLSRQRCPACGICAPVDAEDCDDLGFDEVFIVTRREALAIALAKAGEA